MNIENDIIVDSFTMISDAIKEKTIKIVNDEKEDE